MIIKIKKEDFWRCDDYYNNKWYKCPKCGYLGISSKFDNNFCSGFGGETIWE